jgi:predicted dehydrogenase
MLRIGILGAAGIAPQALIRPARRRDDVEVAAVASRREAAAAAYAETHAIPIAYGGYEALLADMSIDLVYNALPPSEHARLSIAALEAGKDVLCEKPIAMNARQARHMADAAARTGRRLVEAFHDRYHPLTARVLQLLRDGTLGELHSIDAAFSVMIPFDPASIRHDPAVGGGALMDLGCYPVHWLRSLVGEEPDVVEASYSPNPMGVDETVQAILRFPSGVQGRVLASMAADQVFEASIVARGTRGTLEVDNPVLPHNGHSVRLTIGGLPRTFTVGADQTYDYQLQAVVAALAGGPALPAEADDFVPNMTTIDAIYGATGLVRDVP